MTIRPMSIRPVGAAMARSGEHYLYQDLARQIEEAIRAGTLRIGDRIASVRKLSSQHSVSISTAMQALRHLENQRLIEARPKSGFFVARRPRELAEPATSRPPQSPRYVVTPSLLRDYIDSLYEPEAESLGAVLPGPDMFPGERIARLLAAVARRHPELAVAHPGLSKGAAELRNVIARRSLEHGLRITAEDIIVTDGCLEALSLALRAVARPGDTIALESPTYFLLLQNIESLGMKALEIPTHPRAGLSLEAFELATRRTGSVKAALVVPTHSNPLGSSMPDENRRRLVELCADRGIPLIEDDIYGEVTFAGPRPRPLKAWDKQGNVLLCSSFSKAVAPGLRIGWIVPGRYQKEVEMLKLGGNMFTAHIPQLALAEFVSNGGYDHHLRRLRAIAGRQAELMRQAVAASFPANCRITRPCGGYVLWVELPPKVSAVEVFQRARAERIVIAPGPLFTSTDRFANCIRLSFSRAWSRGVERAVDRLGQILRQMV